MPKRHPEETRRKVLDLVAAGRPIAQDAAVLGVSLHGIAAQAAAARASLEQARIEVERTVIRAPAAGVVGARAVRPGQYVRSGAALMSVVPLGETYVVANFKETQLSYLRIGQPVDLITDMYGGRHVFKGRISGFTMGTGSTLALLPPENATGNFVKVVQRLPVRVEILNYDPYKVPLFVGLSVTPNVHIRETPIGPDAGQFLQGAPTLPPVGKTETPAK